ncbi:MAG: transcriptional regulator, LacI family [Capsulimonas sp.]|jgi:DNA-binding LacI/PurR family transcriptional regulator|nr:transcriptional regulator, LacI family [Capsulimonas sp.]
MRGSRKTRTMPVTSKDIAEKLGLSQPTVSRILSGTQGYRASTETRQRVLEAAREMGYRPNAIARSLRGRRTDIVGFHTGYNYMSVRDAYMAAVLGGLQRVCDAKRVDILLLGVFHGRNTDDIYGELVNGRIDGLFLHTSAEDPLVAELAQSALPVVSISDAIPSLPSVVADDTDGIRQTVDYLWSRGHRRIAYIAPERHMISVDRRVETFREEMAKRRVSDATVIHREFTYGDASEDDGNLDETLNTLLALPERPTAACCWNDPCAMHLLRSCAKLGMRAPRDLAVVGFDGSLDQNLMMQTLTTIAVPWDTLATRALEVLRAQIQGGEVPRETIVPVTLLRGETA